MSSLTSGSLATAKSGCISMEVMLSMFVTHMFTMVTSSLWVFPLSICSGFVYGLLILSAICFTDRSVATPGCCQLGILTSVHSLYVCVCVFLRGVSLTDSKHLGLVLLFALISFFFFQPASLYHQVT